MNKANAAYMYAMEYYSTQSEKKKEMWMWDTVWMNHQNVK